MKTLKKIKLNDLNDAELKDREMNDLYGGRACSCSCSTPGGSASGGNGNGNYHIGPSGGHSVSGAPVVCFSETSTGPMGSVYSL